MLTTKIYNMNGLELLKKALAHQKVERVPWVPFVGVHGGYLIGADAETYLKSSEKIIEGVGKAIEKYNPKGSRLFLIYSWKPKFWDASCSGLHTIRLQ